MDKLKAFIIANKKEIIIVASALVVISGYLIISNFKKQTNQNQDFFANTNLTAEKPAPTNEAKQSQSVNLNDLNVTDSSAVIETKMLALVINDQADSQGTVEENKNFFPPATLKIYVSAYIEKAQKDQVVSAYLTYNPTGDQVGPVNNISKQAGNIISNFSFTKPEAGWPIGDYLIKISLADGQSKEATFTIK